jgi:streptogramin lyase
MNRLLSVLSRSVRRPQFTSRKTHKSHRKTWRARPCLEALEDRLVLSPTISIANASVNEIGNVSPFIASGSGGLSNPIGLVQGPDGNIYVVSSGTNSVIRYSPTGQLIGTFVASGSGGLAKPDRLAFGPDGNLYVDSTATNAIYEYSGSTGAFLSTFVSAGSGGLNDPTGMVFGPDGNLYVSSAGTHSILRYQGPEGSAPGSPLPAAGQTGATFVPAGSGNLDSPDDLVFGPNGNLFVSSVWFINGNSSLGNVTTNGAVLEFDGTSGNFITTYVAPGEGGLVRPTGLAFDQQGQLYVADGGTWSVHLYGSQGQYLDDPVTMSASETGSASSLSAPIGIVFNAQGDLLVSSRNNNLVSQYSSGVTVTLSAASTSPVTVQYATSDGTAVAGTDYTAQTGTMTFAPEQTSLLIPLVTLWNATPPGNDYFNVQLSNPSGATIANGSAVVTIVPPTLPQLTISSTSAIEGDPTAHYRGAAAWGQPSSHFNPVTIET